MKSTEETDIFNFDSGEEQETLLGRVISPPPVVHLYSALSPETGWTRENQLTLNRHFILVVVAFIMLMLLYSIICSFTVANFLIRRIIFIHISSL